MGRSSAPPRLIRKVPPWTPPDIDATAETAASRSKQVESPVLASIRPEACTSTSARLRDIKKCVGESAPRVRSTSILIARSPASRVDPPWARTRHDGAARNSVVRTPSRFGRPISLVGGDPDTDVTRSIGIWQSDFTALRETLLTRFLGAATPATPDVQVFAGLPTPVHQ